MKHPVQESVLTISIGRQRLFARLCGHELPVARGNQAEAGGAPQPDSSSKGFQGGQVGLRSLLVVRFQDSHQSLTMSPGRCGGEPCFPLINRAAEAQRPYVMAATGGKPKLVMLSSSCFTGPR